ncbi:MAG: haloalkane dehalogenase 3 [Acidimicrobiia bacterium]|nr:MAG: haloalkane dehalogenase 3 [Acidimicrobiia bacterium]
MMASVGSMPAPAKPLKKKKVEVLGLRMAYHESGKGRPIVFLHGNPTSSYLWRGVIPHVSSLGRCIAPDLIGMGDSAKLVPSGSNTYTFSDHRRYLDALLEVMGVTEDVVLVVHDWGGALGFDWARRHPRSVAGIAYMETIVAPLDSWDAWPEPSRGLFQALRTEAGEEIILAKNVFVERILPASVLDPLPPEVMEEYRRPFRRPGEDRRPTLTWPRQIPIGGDPPDVAETVARYRDWLSRSDVPKLFVDADPGFLSPLMRPVCEEWPNQEKVTVRGIHFIQEDSPDEIGRALADWLRRI